MKAFCISHVKDVDGVGAAAIVRAATGAEFLLSDYATLLEDLGKVPKGVDQFFLCDLGCDNADVKDFIAAMAQLAKRAKVTYVDHHLMSAAVRESLENGGVRVVHDESECSSMLAYDTFKDEVPLEMRLTALMGAVTDYMDGSPLASKMMEQADRQFVLLEATMLAYAMGKKAGKGGFPQKVVRELAALRHPHEIEGVAELAVSQLADITKLGKVVARKGKRIGNMACMQTTQQSTGNVAKLLIGAFAVPVGLAYKEQERGWFEISLRGTSGCKVHLGETIGKIASDLGGSGGGHRKAAGARVRKGKMEELLARLKAEV